MGVAPPPLTDRNCGRIGSSICPLGGTGTFLSGAMSGWVNGIARFLPAENRRKNVRFKDAKGLPVVFHCLSLAEASLPGVEGVKEKLCGFRGPSRICCAASEKLRLVAFFFAKISSVDARKARIFK